MDSSVFKRYVDVAWRRKWWFLVPMMLAAATGALVIGMMPKTYRATTTILVTRPTVPDDVVRNTATQRLEERMRGLKLRILSRSYLEPIAREFKMIPEDAPQADIETVCWMLAARIDAEFDARDYAWFRISVGDRDPKRAAGIANRLADLFIAQSSQMRASQAAGTLEATRGWEEKYRLDLAKRDEEISAFKRMNGSELPDQQPANVQFLNGAQNRLAQLTSEIRSRTDRLAALRAELQAQQAKLDHPVAGIGPAIEDPRLAARRQELAELLGTYTEENPIVMRKRAQIVDLIRSSPAGAAPVLADAALVARRDAIAIEMATIESELQGPERDRARELAAIETNSAHIGNAPQVQQKLFELTRDYEQVKHQFDAAVAQSELAKRSQDLEAANSGEQFQIQDRAYPATVPFNSNLRYLLAVIALGVVTGVGSAAVRELLDQTVRSEDEFVAEFPDLPVYGVISSLDVILEPPLPIPAGRTA